MSDELVNLTKNQVVEAIAGIGILAKQMNAAHYPADLVFAIRLLTETYKGLE